MAIIDKIWSLISGSSTVYVLKDNSGTQSSHMHTKSQITDFPTIPAAANNGTLTIQKNGTNVAQFDADSASDVTANISVPTALSELSSDTTHRVVTDIEKSTWNNMAPTNHASTATTYGVGDATNFGHVKVDSALDETSNNPVRNSVIKGELDKKQDTLQSQTPFTTKGSATKVPQITTNSLGQVTNISEVTISNPGISHMYFNTTVYALRINVGNHAVRNGGISLLVQAVCNNGYVALIEISCWKSGSSGVERVEAHVVYRNDRSSGIPQFVSYKSSTSTSVENYIYIFSKAATEWSTSFTVLGNSQRLAENNESVVCERVSRNEATSADTTEIAVGVSDAFIATLYSTGTNEYNTKPADIYNAIRDNRPIIVHDIYKGADNYQYVLVDPSSNSDKVMLSRLYIDNSINSYQRLNAYEVTLNNGDGKWDNIDVDLLKSTWATAQNSYFSGTSRLAGYATNAGSADSATNADYVRFNNDNEINFRNLASAVTDNRNVWFEYRNGDTGEPDTSNPVQKFIFGNRNKLVDGVSLVAGRLRLHNGSSVSANSGNYAELRLGSDGNGTEGAGSDHASPKIVLQGSSNPRFGVFVTNEHAGSAAKGVQLDAANNADPGIWGYNNGNSKFICHLLSDGTACLGKDGDNGDVVVKLGKYRLDFSGTVGTDSNTIYFL